jgi:predicted transcriptional regulator
MALRPALMARTLAVTRGEKHAAADDLGIWFTSTESCAKVLAAGNRELLRVIAAQPPGSLDELARCRDKTHRCSARRQPDVGGRDGGARALRPR